MTSAGVTDVRAEATLVETRRQRLNLMVMLLPIQWCSLMVVYWIRFLPPLRPYDFGSVPPSGTMALAALAVCCVPLVLPDGYFRPARFERGPLYPRLGVRLFRRLAPDGDFVNRRIRRIDPSYRVVHNRATLREHIVQSRRNERLHGAQFLAGAFTAVHAVGAGEMVFALLLGLTNVAFNLYPVLHQRHKRARTIRAC